MKEQSEASHSNPDQPINWLMFGQLWLDINFFNRGLIILHTNEPVMQEAQGINFNGRILEFSSDSLPNGGDKRAGKKNYSLLSKLFSGQGKAGADKIYFDPNPDFIFNRARRDEQFFPIRFSNGDGTYVYPWGQTCAVEFRGFSHFVTAGCMFGGNLKAVLNTGGSFPIIDHAVTFPADQMIVDVVEDSSASPFEITLFSEFEKTCKLIDALAVESQDKKLTYHLPGYDYILFCMKLYVQKLITEEAFHKFISRVLIKTNEHMAQLISIAEKHKIEISFTSPFEGVFAGTTLTTQSVIARIETIVKTSETSEAQAVKACLDALYNSNRPNQYSQLWEKVLKSPAHSGHITDFESLFRIGNSLVIAQVNEGTNGQVCTIYPLTEKQIQVNYDSLAKKGLVPKSRVTHLTTLDPVITYTPTTNGLLFYCACLLGSLGDALKEKGLLEKASKNLGLFADKGTRSPSIGDATNLSKP